MYKSKHTGVEIDNGIDRMQYVTNPNLLDNWYFANPVNQRGQTEYSDAGYSIDRWKLAYSLTSLVLGEKGVTLGTATTSTRFMSQSIEFPERLYGQQVTLSALVDGVGLVYATETVPSVFPSSSTRFLSLTNLGNSTSNGMYIGTTGVLVVQFAAAVDNSFTLIAVKLEVGSQQTLAHQDASGNWVLNEIPNYAEQLRRCRRYFRRLDASMVFFSGVATSADTAASFTVPHAEAMRTNPSVNTSADFSLVVYTQTGFSSIAPNTAPFGVPSTVTCLANVGHGLNITATFGTAGVAGTNNTLVMVRIRTGYIDLSADL